MKYKLVEKVNEFDDSIFAKNNVNMISSGLDGRKR